jgi:hypothetical protein
MISTYNGEGTPIKVRMQPMLGADTMLMATLARRI